MKTLLKVELDTKVPQSVGLLSLKSACSIISHLIVPNVMKTILLWKMIQLEIMDRLTRLKSLLLCSSCFSGFIPCIGKYLFIQKVCLAKQQPWLAECHMN